MSIEKNIIAIGGGGFGRTIKDLRIEEYILKISKNLNAAKASKISYIFISKINNKGIDCPINSSITTSDGSSFSI